MVGLSKHWTFEPFRLFLSNEQIDFFIVHLCGLILDLSASFLMYFDKTRWLGKYCSISSCDFPKDIFLPCIMFPQKSYFMIKTIISQSIWKTTMVEFFIFETTGL